MHLSRLHILSILLLLLGGLWLPAFPQAPAERLSVAQEAFRNQKPAEALEAFRSYLGGQPEGPRATEVHYRVAQCLDQLGRSSEARASLEDWLATAPPDPWQVRGWILLADLRARGGQARGAEAAYTRALEVSGRVPGTVEDRLQALLGRGRLRASAPEFKDRRPAAETDLVEVIRGDFRGLPAGEARLVLGDLYLKTPEVWDLTLDRAVDVWREMARVQPQHPLVPEARLRSARAFNASRRHRDAREDLEALLQAFPRSAQASEAARMLADLQKPRLSLPPWTVSRPGRPAQVPLRIRNLSGLQIEAWKVDLVQAVAQGANLQDLASGLTPTSPSRLRLSVPSVDLQDHRWRRQGLELNLTEPGVYLLEARSQGTRSRGLLLVTDLIGVCLAGSEGEATVWLVDAARGQGVWEAEAWLVSPTGSDRPLESLAVSGAGLVTMPALSAPTRRFLLARRGQDHLILPDLRSPGRLPSWRAVLETDRSGYHGGERLRWKAVVRSVKPEGYAVPAGHPFLLEVLDPKGRRFHQTRIQASPLGTLRGEVPLPQESLEGTWTLRLQDIAGSGPPVAMTRSFFTVAASETDRLRLRLRPAQSWWVWGEKAHLDLEVRDALDRPVPGARVEWQARGRTLQIRPPSDPELDWFRSVVPLAPSPGSGVSRGTGQARTDARGRVALAMPLTAPNQDPGVEGLEVQVRVWDSRNREGLARTEFVVGPSAVVLHLAAEGDVQPGHPATVRVQAWDLEGRPAPVSVQLRQVLPQVKDFGPLQLDRRGRGTLPWTPQGSGPWSLEAQARGSRGGAAQARLLASRTEPAPGDFWMRTDRRRYRPGQVARVDLGTPRDGAQVLLTMEGREVVRRMVVECPTRTTRVELPIGRDLAPGFRLRATTLRDSRVLSVDQEILAPDPAQVLEVQIEPLTPPVPGQPGRIRVRTVDSEDRPVESEVSLALVSQEALPGEPRHRLVPAFFGPPSTHAVVTGTSLVTPAAVPALPLPSPASAPGWQPVGETAFWSPELRTSPEGVAEVSLTWPLRPGRWRLLARAVAGRSRMGESTTFVDLEARLGLRLEGPEHLVEGDSAVYSAVLENPGREALALRLQAQATHLALEGADVAELQVSGGGRETWPLPVRTRGAGSVEMLVTAQAPGVKDRARRVLQVAPAGQIHEQVRAGSVEDSAVLDLAALPASAREPRLEVAISPGLAALLGSAVEPLMATLPSNEGLVSRAVPALVLVRALKELELPCQDLEERLPGVVEDSLRRLGHAQNADGGWGWWEGMPSDLSTTAYVCRGLVHLEKGGSQSAAPLLEKACAYLRKGQAKLPAEARPAVLLALSEAHRASGRSLLSLVGPSIRLEPASRVQLALALQGMGYAEAARDQLRRARQGAEHDGRAGLAWWPAGAGWTRVEATALALEAHLLLEPEHPLTEAAALWLAQQRGLKGWASPRETALAVTALARFLARLGEKPSAFGYGIWINGNEVETGRIAPPDWTGTRLLSLRGAQIPEGPLRVEIRKGGGGRSWWCVRLSSVGPRLAGNLDLSRRHYRLEPSGRRQLLEDGGRLQVGDRVETVLELKAPRRLRCLAIEEHSAAGLEPEPPGALPAGTRVQMRPQGPTFHLQEVAPGLTRLAWKAHVTSAGSFTSLPARVWEVHAPQVHGASLPWKVTIGRNDR